MTAGRGRMPSRDRGSRSLHDFTPTRVECSARFLFKKQGGPLGEQGEGAATGAPGTFLLRQCPSPPATSLGSNTPQIPTPCTIVPDPQSHRGGASSPCFLPLSLARSVRACALATCSSHPFFTQGHAEHSVPGPALTGQLVPHATKDGRGAPGADPAAAGGAANGRIARPGSRPAGPSAPAPVPERVASPKMGGCEALLAVPGARLAPAASVAIAASANGRVIVPRACPQLQGMLAVMRLRSSDGGADAADEARACVRLAERADGLVSSASAATQSLRCVGRGRGACCGTRAVAAWMSTAVCKPTCERPPSYCTTGWGLEISRRLPAICCRPTLHVARWGWHPPAGTRPARGCCPVRTSCSRTCRIAPSRHCPRCAARRHTHANAAPRRQHPQRPVMVSPQMMSSCLCLTHSSCRCDPLPADVQAPCAVGRSPWSEAGRGLMERCPRRPTYRITASTGSPPCVQL